MRRKAGIAVAALILATQLGSAALAARPTLEQLEIMTAYLEANDIVGLRGFFLLYPDLLDGDDSFAVTMRKFMDETEDVSTYLAFEPDIRDALDDTLDETPEPLRIEETPDPPATEPEPQPGPIPEGPPGY